MNFSLREIDAQQLDEFYNSFEGEKTFLQTSKYGNFREKLGEKNFRYGIFKESTLLGIAQFQRIPARRGTHLHLPHGPLFLPRPSGEGWGEGDVLKFFLSEYKRIGQEEKCDFVRISPLIKGEAEGVKKLFQKENFKAAPIHLVNPERTWVLDITQSEEEILAHMRKSTRYEVRRIEKCGITVQKGNSKKDLDIFWSLHTETVKRQHFIPFARKTTETELEVFGNDVQIFNAFIEQKKCSSSIIIFDSHAGYYHQGASVYSKFPVAHATLWEAIREAKKRGCKEFNFWGICEDEQVNHPWYGLSKFKRGFGGEERVFLHAQDFPLTSKYWLNWAVEKWRKWKRNY